MKQTPRLSKGGTKEYNQTIKLKLINIMNILWRKMILFEFLKAKEGWN